MSAQLEGTNVFDETFSIKGSREQVWRALTSAEAVATWFAEHAEIEPRVGGAYRFWGKHTPNYGVPSETNQRITAIQDRELLAFNWKWGGAPTRCSMHLEAAGEGVTTLRITHKLDGPIATYSEEVSAWIARDFWRVAMANLEHYVQTGTPILLVDHYESGPARDVKVSIDIDAPASAIWESLTDPEQLRVWLSKDPDFPCDPAVDLRVGGKYSYGWSAHEECGCVGPGEILELEPGRRLVHTWHHDGDDTDRTEWTIEKLAPDRSRLTVRQIGTSSPREFSGYSNGWAAYLIEIRRVRVEP